MDPHVALDVFMLKAPVCCLFVPIIPVLQSSLADSRAVPKKSRAGHPLAQIVKIRLLLNPNKGNKM